MMSVVQALDARRVHGAAWRALALGNDLMASVAPYDAQRDAHMLAAVQNVFTGARTLPCRSRPTLPTLMWPAPQSRDRAVLVARRSQAPSPGWALATATPRPSLSWARPGRAPRC